MKLLWRHYSSKKIIKFIVNIIKNQSYTLEITYTSIICNKRVINQNKFNEPFHKVRFFIDFYNFLRQNLTENRQKWSKSHVFEL